jgi:DNA-binding Lrp family transcriptional regulator
MGRYRSYRERINFETLSVESKSLKSLLSRELQNDYGLSKLESDVLSLRSLIWLQDMNSGPLPGQLLKSVPATPIKKYALTKRTKVKLTVVDINRDGEIWREFGLAVMQRGRALRLIYETWRQGGWASYSELSSLLNVTPNALSNRLRELKEFGVWLPHVGNKNNVLSGSESLFHSVIIKKFLDSERTENLREVFSLTVSDLELILRNAVTIWDLQNEGCEISKISQFVGLHSEEVESILSVVKDYAFDRKKSWEDLYQCYRSKGDGASVFSNSPIPSDSNADKNLEDENLDLLDILEKEHGMFLISGRIYLRRLRELADRLSIENGKREGETIFFAISSDEGPRTRLSEGKIIPVCLEYFSPADLEQGPRGSHKNRVSDLKFARILRYTTQAYEQSSLLSIPDLAMLMGIGIDAIRRLIKANPQIIVPTRGLIKDIGRSVSHKCEIVELYLQVYTETEIVERTGHCYESIEAYLKEFARVVTLADGGLNDVMIRRVTGRSMSLVRAYLDLYQKYDNNPDYVFRIAHLKNVFSREDAGEKRTPSAPSNEKKKLPFSHT